MKKFLKSVDIAFEYTVAGITILLGFLGIIMWMVSPVVLTIVLINSTGNGLWGLLFIPISASIVILYLLAHNKFKSD